jgi:hypothetical protein
MIAHVKLDDRLSILRAREIESGDGIRSMISVFVAFTSENSKVGKLRSDAFPGVDINCVVPLLDVFQGHINGFIRKHRSFLRWPGTCGALAGNRHTARRSHQRGHMATEYE